MKNSLDYIIIGSGFGGSVSAMRLSEKGYSVLVLEKGRRYQAHDFPKTNWDVRRYLWLPLLKCFGIQNIAFFKNVLVLSGTGVGGGSLVYANTLMEPKDAFYQDPIWSKLADWKNILKPHYDSAKKMLGVAKNPMLSEGDEILKKTGVNLGCGETFHSVDVGVYFGEPNKTVKDPYFGGVGPDRTGCRFCGGCMVGCQFNSKNTLDKNYLYFAEKNGVQIIADQQVICVEPSDNGYEVTTRRPSRFFETNPQKYNAKNVIFAGGVLGTVKLLMKLKYVDQTLPFISDRVGHSVRTNGESLLGVTAIGQKKDYTKGLAISSAIHPDAVTKIEVVRYPAGSGFMRLLALPMVGPGNMIVRPIKFFSSCITRMSEYIKLFKIKDWSSNTIILLVMQTIDQKLSFKMKRRWYTLFNWNFGTESVGERLPAYIEVAGRAGKDVAQQINGVIQNAFTEPLLNIPATAHILGGATMGTDQSEGVIDSKGQVFNYPGLYVVDGSMIPANLGVNPSLTITALAEYVMSQIPNASPQPSSLIKNDAAAKLPLKP